MGLNEPGYRFDYVPKAFRVSVKISLKFNNYSVLTRFSRWVRNKN